MPAAGVGGPYATMSLLTECHPPFAGHRCLAAEFTRFDATPAREKSRRISRAGMPRQLTCADATLGSSVGRRV